MRHLVTIVLSLLVASPTFAWHDRGHRITAAIAYEQLSADTQARIADVLRQHPRFEEDFVARMPSEIGAANAEVQDRWIFEHAATWADIVRATDGPVRDQFNRTLWHFINVPIWLAPEDEELLEGRLSHNMALQFSPPLRQNLNVVQALRGNLIVWRDVNASDAEKAVALCWILHLVGDLHQPLHNVALFSAPYFPEGDRGGNSIAVDWIEGERWNLHAVWDSLPTNMDDHSPSDRTRRSIETDTVDDEAIEEWLSHHANLAARFVYTGDVKAQILDRVSNRQLPIISLSHNYVVAARSIARRQINLAGHRIAALIEQP